MAEARRGSLAGGAGRRSRTAVRIRGRSPFERRASAWILLTPALVVVFSLKLYPLGRTFFLSFRDAGFESLITGESAFIGLDHYAAIFTDAHLRGVFFTTVVFGVACVAGTMIIGLAVALLLNQRFRGRALLGILVLLPWAMPKVAASIVWKWMFNDQYGFVNWALTSAGLDSFAGFPWFNDRLTAFVAIGIVVIWQSFPFVALSLLAGLQTIPDELTDAAKVDGAGPWQTLMNVTLPLLKPLILILLVIETIWDFRVFDQIYVMTGGGPARSTEVLAVATWREAFAQLDFGLGSALAVVTFVLLAVVTLLYIRMMRQDEALT